MAQSQVPPIRRNDAPAEALDTSVSSTPPALDPTIPADPDAPLITRFPSARTLARWLLVAVTLYGIVWLLYQSWSALTPFVIGLVLAFLLTPFVNRLSRKMPRWAAILTVYVAGTVLLVISFGYIVPPVIDQINQLVNNIPPLSELQSRLSEVILLYRERVPESLQAQIDPAIAGAIESLRGNIAGYVQLAVNFILNQLITIVNTITFLIGFLIIPIWLFYILNDQDDGRKFINNVLHPRIRADFWNTWSMTNKVFSDYIRGQLVLCLAVGIAVGVGLFIVQLLGINLEYILLLAIIAGITEFIPVLGPIIGSIPGIILAFVVAGPQGAIAALVVYIIVQQLENNFLVPRIVGESVGVHPAVLTVVLIAMSQVFGLIGVILSAPLTAIARDLFIYAYSRLGGSTPQLAMATVQHRTKTANAEPRSISGDRKTA